MTTSISDSEAGYRSYEVYQRERVHEATPLIRPGVLRSADYLADPYPFLAVLREEYPCYRDWRGNSFWITRYDDVTSVLTDDASFETRPRRWFAGLDHYGRDLGQRVEVTTAWTAAVDQKVEAVTALLLDDLETAAAPDLAMDLAARLPIELLTRALDLPAETAPTLGGCLWRMSRAAQWEPQAAQEGRAAMDALAQLVRPLMEQRRASPGTDVLSAIAALDLEDGPATAEDVVVTLLEADNETLHGALANMWFLLLTHPEQLAVIRDDRRLVKFAYLETLRHSTPVISGLRFTTREVERWGRLLPEGALVVCSAAAGNRDPRQFDNPDHFMVERKDLCQREPRGQYRADGLPAGIAVGLGPPSRYPALPPDRPRSLYARTRDTATIVSSMLLDRFPQLALAPEVAPTLRSLRVGEMHTCWRLPVRLH